MKEQEFDALYKRFYGLVYKICRDYLQNEAETEDAAQETFVKAWVNIDKYDQLRPFEPWIATIAQRVCLDRLRKRKRQREQMPEVAVPETGDDMLENDPADPEISVPGETEEQELYDLLNQALAQLEDEERVVFLLHQREGLSWADISTRLQITVMAARWRHGKAIGKIKTFFVQNGYSFDL